jgi:hypothetical protein
VLTPNQVLWIKFQVFTGSPIHPPPLGALSAPARRLTGGPRLSAAVPLSRARSLSRSLPGGANLSAPVSFTRLVSLSASRARFASCRAVAPRVPFALSAPWTYPVSSAPSALAVDQRVRTCAHRLISRPRCLLTCPTPILEPRQCPAHTPRFISHTLALSRALPSPPDAAGDPRPRSRPSNSPDTTPSLPELRREVRHPSPCPISLIAPCVRPISPLPVLGRGGSPCSRGGRPI